MAIYIKKIELKNWFSYYGDYKENTFNFTNGVNIVVAGNDIGKTKLHNAIRWLLDDTVIFKRGTDYVLEQISAGNIKDVINFKAQNVLQNSESVTVGVRVTFVEEVRGEKKERRLTKEFEGYREVNTIRITAGFRKRVEKIERNTIKTAIEDFDELTSKIIRPNLRSFFLVQGESLENMTPLRGAQLLNTINNLVSINELDKVSERAFDLANKTQTLRQQIENQETQHNKKLKEKIIIKTRSEERLNTLNGIEIPMAEENLKIANDKIEKFRGQAQLAKSRTAQVKKINDFNKSIAILEGNLESKYKNLVENLISNDFSLTKITDDSEISIKLNEKLEDFKSYSSLRRTELDSKLDKNEQKMLHALEKSQPKPQILQQMKDEGICYVCANPLNENSIKYIGEKLIPFFLNELEAKDEELDNYSALISLYQNLKYSLDEYIRKDYNYFDNRLSDIIRIEKAKREEIDKKDDFISENGNQELEGSEEVSILTYDQALEDRKNWSDRIENFEEEKKTLLNILKNLKRDTDREEEDESPQLKEIKELEEFTILVKEELHKVKTREYEEFAAKLEEVIQEKFHSLTVNNDKFQSQSMKVIFTMNSRRQPDFEIQVVDQFNNSLYQSGGASQALRQLAVIFGLIDLSGKRTNYPFIADAPTSNMSHNLSETFFNYQLKNSPTQNILITKEFWDDEFKTLNDIGTKILNKVKETPEASMIVLKSPGGKGLEITTL